MEFEFIGDSFSIVTGGKAQETDFSSYLEMELGVDLETFMGWQGGEIFFQGIGIDGGAPSNEVNSVQTISNVEAPNSFKLFQAWYQHTFFNGQARWLIGLYDLDYEFDIQELSEVFINGAFGTGLDLSEVGGSGPPIFPVSSLSTRIKVNFLESFYLMAAVSDGIPGDPDDPFGTQIILDKDDGILVAVEAGYRSSSKNEPYKKFGLGSWAYTTDFDDISEINENGSPIQRSGAKSIYAFYEGLVLPEENSSEQGLGLFGRLGFADENVSRFKWHTSAGLVYKGLIAGRDDDVLGLGVSAAFLGDNFKTAQNRNGLKVDEEEIVLEASYLHILYPWLSIQPDVQYFINPGNDANLKNALVIGLRFMLSF